MLQSNCRLPCKFSLRKPPYPSHSRPDKESQETALGRWYDIEPSDDKPLKEGEKSAQVKLSIELHGVKATED